MDEYSRAVHENDEQSTRIMKLENDFKKKLGIRDGVPDLEIKYIGESNGISVIGMFLDGKIFKYYNAKGVELLNMEELLKKKYWIKKSLQLLGYSQDIEDTTTINKKDNNEKIYPTGISHYELFRQIEYLVNKFLFITFLGADSKKYSKPFPLGSLKKFFNLKLIRFEDIDSLIEHNKISKKDSTILRKYIKESLKNQCLDERYYLTGEEMTKMNLDMYLSKKYIDKKLYNQCLELIKIRNNKNISKIKIQTETKDDIKKDFNTISDIG